MFLPKSLIVSQIHSNIKTNSTPLKLVNKIDCVARMLRSLKATSAYHVFRSNI